MTPKLFKRHSDGHVAHAAPGSDKYRVDSASDLHKGQLVSLRGRGTKINCDINRDLNEKRSTNESENSRSVVHIINALIPYSLRRKTQF